MKLTTSYPTYINTLCNLSSWQRKLCATTGAALLLGLAANISIPTYPVPFTLQSLAVLLIGAFLGRKLGALTILQYLFLGAIGLPLFANGSGGIMALASPSAGYLYGYVFSAYVAGFAAEKGYDRRFILGLIAFACAHQLLFVFGVVYLMGYMHISLIEALKVGYLPFVGVDAAKFIIATCVMFSLWRHHARK
ncbi:biotin transporter BioY [Gilliamella sp. B2838]|uniref:biotin transporter BioY n=1 Tax=Gilliamella sp. B2838 TaxID=2818020 RepID=UPI002269C0DD|nr:biotin transporter BioY [Gilliamella sp. B2838]MCX8728435.1 biotin transporter BioY [Gilliamella sp. B2838]